MVRASSRSAVLALIAAFLLSTLAVLPVAADDSAQAPPFEQDWTNTGLITANDNWSGVPGIVGFLGQDITTATATDPQTLLTTSANAADVDVIANQTSTSITNGGIAEFEIANPVVALQGSGTADAPYLLLNLNTSGLAGIGVSYAIRDIDATADNAIQPVALHYRVGNSGNFTNVPAAFVPDATVANEATLVTPVSVTLPAVVNDQPLVQVRVMTTNAAGSDEWIGIDDIAVSGATGDQAPSVQATSPSNGANNVPVNATVSVTFSEEVTLDAGALSLDCTPAAPASVDSGPATTFEFVLLDDLPEGAECSIDVDGSKVHDVDADDPPDVMAGTHSSAFAVFSPVVTADINVSQVYGGGGNSGAQYSNDFIELYNPTEESVSLAGWSVQYASAAGSTWSATPLAGSIPAAGHYLVQEAAGATPSVPLPDPDATGSIAMAAGSGKVALVNSTTPLAGTCPVGATIVDFVGYGTANCFEGTGAAPTLSNTTAGLRADNGATDTDVNADDFTAGPPNPRASVDSSPKIASTFPAPSSVAPAYSNIVVTFTEPVDVAGAWFTIDCTTTGTHAAAVSGGPTTYTVNPTADFVGGESCSVTIHAANVTDVDVADPPDAMTADAVVTFTIAADIACAPNATAISAIQGSGAASPLTGSVVEIQGVVVGSYLGSDKLQGFHVQEEDADQDGDPATSDGIFVFEPNGGSEVEAGDTVRVRGTVTEFNTSGVTLTELGGVTNVEPCATGATVTPTEVALPFESATYGERYESMLVEIDQELTVTETFTLGRFGEVVLAAGGRLANPTNVVAPGGPALALQAQNNLRRIVLDDGDGRQNIDPTVYPAGGLSAANTLRVGDTTDGGTFVFEQRFGVYRLQPTADLAAFDPSNPRQASPDAVGGNIRVASFNVLNYFNGDGTGGGFPTARGAETQFEFERQRAKIISALVALDADIVGVNELENDAGTTSAIADLVAGLNAATAPGTYAYIDTGVVGTDEIRVALLYRPAIVTPVGSHAILDSSVDPAFIDTLNRPAVAQTFERKATGSRVTVAANHLKSKGSDCNAVGDPDAGDGQGNCNGTRTAAAAALVDWLASDPTGQASEMSLIIGDLNSYAMEDPITAIKDAGYTNLLEAFVGLGAYSYVFEGQSGYLDHALANDALLPEVTGVTEWHINADEPTVLDYNVNFKSAGHISTLYAPDAFRSSDHDPVVIGLVLAGAPTVDAGGPYEIVEGGSGTLTATGSEPDGAALTYEWDLDGDGTFESTGQSVTFSAAGLEAPDSIEVTVRATGPTGLTASDTADVHIIWDFGGFSGPVHGRPTVDSAKTGSTIAVRFDLDGDQGLAIITAGYPTSIAYSCGGTKPTDGGTPTTGGGLTYEASSGLYTYEWKTDRSWANTCRSFILKLADGTYHYVDVRFKK